MGLNVSYALSCDHCGRETPVSLRASRTLPEAIAAARLDEDGWEQVGTDRVVCPACAPKWHALADRHAREAAEFPVETA